VLSRATARIRFLGVLHALFRESISITDLGALLDAFRTLAPEHQDPIELAEAVRSVVRPVASGVADGAKLMALAPVFEETIERGVVESNGQRVLSLPHHTGQQLRAAVRRSLGGLGDEPATIVTRRQGLRPYVRRLLEIDFPRVKVLNFRELPRPVRQKLTAEVEYP
jgi:flagellar biosynthesis component FlhA